MNEEQLEQNLDSNEDLSYDDIVAQTRAMADKLRNGENIDNETEPEEQPQVATEGDNETPEPTQNTEVQDEVNTIEQFEKPVLLKDRDIEIPVYSMDELIKLAHQGLNFTRKTQEIAPARKILKFAKDNGLDESKLEQYIPILADIDKGNKDAVTKLAQLKGIDIYELSDEHNYEPNPVQYSEPSEVESVAESILANEELSSEIRRLSNYLPDDVKSILSSDAKALKAFAVDASNGVAQKLIPEAIKLQSMYGGSFMDAYVYAGEQAFKQQNPVQQNVATKPVQNTVNVANRNKAVISKGSANAVNSDDLDVWENGLSDEALVDRIKMAASKYR